MKLLEKLQLIQSKLKAPKNQRNNFGNYNYRSCEDILEAVKPLLEEQKLTLTISDDIVNIGDRYYVKAKVTIQDETDSKTVTAMARESETKKGMDESQITGACSSYARKYALNGLFLIDDTKDADSMDNTHKEVKLEVKTEVKPETDIDLVKIKSLGKENGFTGINMAEFGTFIFAKTGLVLETKNYQSIIDKLKENLIN